MTPAGQEKFDCFLNGKKRSGTIPNNNAGKNMKQIYQVNLSAVELDKFEEIQHYQDLKVITSFIADENLDQIFFKTRGQQVKLNIEQRSNNRKRMTELFAADPQKRKTMMAAGALESAGAVGVNFFTPQKSTSKK